MTNPHRTNLRTALGKLLLRIIQFALVTAIPIGALIAADLLSLQLTDWLLENIAWRDAVAVALLAFSVIFIATAGFALLPSSTAERRSWFAALDRGYRRHSPMLQRACVFVLFAGPAATLAFFALKEIREGDTETNLAIALLAASFIGLLFAIWGRDLIRRLQKVGTGGVEFGVWQEIARIPEMAEPPRPHFDTNLNPWGNRELSSKQRWFYERGSNLLSHLGHLGVNTDELEGTELRRYRGLVLWVGIAALNEGQSEKAFEILKTIEHQRDLDYEELFYLGTAYLWVAIDDKDPDSQDEKWIRSAELLENAVKAKPKEAPAHWALSYVYDELGKYELSIDENKEAIKFNLTRFDTWANWTIAVSQLNLGNSDAAYSALERVPSGAWWGDIWDDEELSELKDELQFQSLVGVGLDV